MAPVPAPIEALPDAVEVPVTTFPKAVEMSIGTIAAVVETRFATVSLVVEIRCASFVAMLIRPVGAPIEAPVDLFTVPIQASIDAITAAIQLLLRAVATAVHALLDEIAVVRHRGRESAACQQCGGYQSYQLVLRLVHQVLLQSNHRRAVKYGWVGTRYNVPDPAPLTATQNFFPATLTKGSMNSGRRALLPAAVLATGMSMWMITGSVAGDLGATPHRVQVASAELAAGQPVDFTLSDLDGRTVRLADYRGRWVVINFWASWCSPCVRELPELVAFQRDNPEVQVIGINFEEGTPEQARTFLDPFAVNFPNLKIGDQPLVPFEPLEGLPTTAIVDPAGQIVERHMGPVTAVNLRGIVDRHRD